MVGHNPPNERLQMERGPEAASFPPSSPPQAPLHSPIPGRDRTSAEKLPPVNGTVFNLKSSDQPPTKVRSPPSARLATRLPRSRSASPAVRSAKSLRDSDQSAAATKSPRHTVSSSLKSPDSKRCTPPSRSSSPHSQDVCSKNSMSPSTFSSPRTAKSNTNSMSPSTFSSPRTVKSNMNSMSPSTFSSPGTAKSNTERLEASPSSPTPSPTSPSPSPAPTSPTSPSLSKSGLPLSPIATKPGENLFHTPQRGGGPTPSHKFPTPSHHKSPATAAAASATPRQKVRGSPLTESEKHQHASSSSSKVKRASRTSPAKRHNHNLHSSESSVATAAHGKFEAMGGDGHVYVPPLPPPPKHAMPALPTSSPPPLPMSPPPLPPPRPSSSTSSSLSSAAAALSLLSPSANASDQPLLPSDHTDANAAGRKSVRVLRKQKRGDRSNVPANGATEEEDASLEYEAAQDKSNNSQRQQQQEQQQQQQQQQAKETTAQSGSSHANGWDSLIMVKVELPGRTGSLTLRVKEGTTARRVLEEVLRVWAQTGRPPVQSPILCIDRKGELPLDLGFVIQDPGKSHHRTGSNVSAQSIEKGREGERQTAQAAALASSLLGAEGSTLLWYLREEKSAQARYFGNLLKAADQEAENLDDLVLQARTHGQGTQSLRQAFYDRVRSRRGSFANTSPSHSSLRSSFDSSPGRDDLDSRAISTAHVFLGDDASPAKSKAGRADPLHSPSPSCYSSSPSATSPEESPANARIRKTRARRVHKRSSSLARSGHNTSRLSHTRSSSYGTAAVTQALRIFRVAQSTTSAHPDHPLPKSSSYSPHPEPQPQPGLPVPKSSSYSLHPTESYSLHPTEPQPGLTLPKSLSYSLHPPITPMTHSSVPESDQIPRTSTPIALLPPALPPFASPSTPIAATLPEPQLTLPLHQSSSYSAKHSRTSSSSYSSSSSSSAAAAAASELASSPSFPAPHISPISTSTLTPPSPSQDGPAPSFTQSLEVQSAHPVDVSSDAAATSAAAADKLASPAQQCTFPGCDMVFSSRFGLKRHLKRTHGQQPQHSSSPMPAPREQLSELSHPHVSSGSGVTTAVLECELSSLPAQAAAQREAGNTSSLQHDTDNAAAHAPAAADQDNTAAIAHPLPENASTTSAGHAAETRTQPKQAGRVNFALPQPRASRGGGVCVVSDLEGDQDMLLAALTPDQRRIFQKFSSYQFTHVEADGREGFALHAQNTYITVFFKKLLEVEGSVARTLVLQEYLLFTLANSHGLRRALCQHHNWCNVFLSLFHDPQGGAYSDSHGIDFELLRTVCAIISQMARYPFLSEPGFGAWVTSIVHIVELRFGYSLQGFEVTTAILVAILNGMKRVASGFKHNLDHIAWDNLLEFCEVLFLLIFFHPVRDDESGGSGILPSMSDYSNSLAMHVNPEVGCVEAPLVAKLLSLMEALSWEHLDANFNLQENDAPVSTRSRGRSLRGSSGASLGRPSSHGHHTQHGHGSSSSTLGSRLWKGRSSRSSTSLGLAGDGPLRRSNFFEQCRTELMFFTELNSLLQGTKTAMAVDELQASIKAAVAHAKLRRTTVKLRPKKLQSCLEDYAKFRLYQRVSKRELPSERWTATLSNSNHNNNELAAKLVATEPGKIERAIRSVRKSSGIGRSLTSSTVPECVNPAGTQPIAPGPSDPADPTAPSTQSPIVLLASPAHVSTTSSLRRLSLNKLSSKKNRPKANAPGSANGKSKAATSSTPRSGQRRSPRTPLASLTTPHSASKNSHRSPHTRTRPASASKLSVVAASPSTLSTVSSPSPTQLTTSTYSPPSVYTSSASSLAVSTSSSYLPSPTQSPSVAQSSQAQPSHSLLTAKPKPNPRSKSAASLSQRHKRRLTTFNQNFAPPVNSGPTASAADKHTQPSSAQATEKQKAHNNNKSRTPSRNNSTDGPAGVDADVAGGADAASSNARSNRSNSRVSGRVTVSMKSIRFR
eukprot:g33255.t1